MTDQNIELFEKALRASGLSFSCAYEAPETVVFSVPCEMNTVHFTLRGGESVYVHSVLGCVNINQEVHTLQVLNHLMSKNTYLQFHLNKDEIVGRYTFALPFGNNGGAEKLEYIAVHIAMLMSLFDWATHETWVLRKDDNEC